MHDDSPTLLSVCSGIGGLDLALERVLGTQPVGYVERDAYAQAVLLARMEEQALGCAPVWDDLLTFPGEQFRGAVDIIAGGIPCQPHSFAGKQRRGDDSRDLIDGFINLVRAVEPQLVFVENVRGFLAGGGIGRLLGPLADLGFDAEWTTLRAAEVGAPHRRERVFVLAYPNSWGRGLVSLRGLLHGERAERGHHADRCSPWPPGPGGDWSGIPEWLHPATVANPASRKEGTSGRKRETRGAVEGAATQPRVCDLADGPPSLVDLAQQYRTDRLRCLGNAVVPQQAEAALRLLLNRIA